MKKSEYRKQAQKIGNPESIEKIASAGFFLSMVFSEVEEFKNVSVPWLDIDREGAGTLVATLVHITSRGVIGSQHGHDSVGITIGSSNVRTKRYSLSSAQ